MLIDKESKRGECAREIARRFLKGIIASSSLRRRSQGIDIENWKERWEVPKHESQNAHLLAIIGKGMKR